MNVRNPRSARTLSPACRSSPRVQFADEMQPVAAPPAGETAPATAGAAGEAWSSSAFAAQAGDGGMALPVETAGGGGGGRRRRLMYSKSGAGRSVERSNWVAGKQEWSPRSAAVDAHYSSEAQQHTAGCFTAQQTCTLHACSRPLPCQPLLWLQACWSAPPTLQRHGARSSGACKRR